MRTTDIEPSKHARMQMQRRRITDEDVVLTLQLGEHLEGKEDGTNEACIELEGRPITVIYDSTEHQVSGVFNVITVLRRRCREL